MVENSLGIRYAVMILLIYVDFLDAPSLILVANNQVALAFWQVFLSPTHQVTQNCRLNPGCVATLHDSGDDCFFPAVFWMLCTFVDNKSLHA